MLILVQKEIGITHVPFIIPMFHELRHVHLCVHVNTLVYQHSFFQHSH